MKSNTIRPATLMLSAEALLARCTPKDLPLQVSLPAAPKLRNRHAGRVYGVPGPVTSAGLPVTGQ